MKNTKKKVLVGALVVSLAAIISMGTIAWFSASNSVENTFKIASSDDPTTDPTFAVDVWENVPDPTEEDPDKTKREDDGHTYDDVMPGDTLLKEAHVENTGTLPQYVRCIVTVDSGNVWGLWLDKDPGTINFTQIVNGFDTAKWSIASKSYDADTNKITYVIYYQSILAAGANDILFTDVKVPSSVDKSFAGAEFKIDVKAQAVQTDNVGASAEEAFATVGMGLDE